MTQPSFTDEQAMGVWLEALEATGTFIRFKPKYARAAATIIRDAVNAALAERDAEIARLRASVKLAAVWFDEYALLHRAKGTEDGNDKGQRNEDRANQLRAALEPKP